MWNNNHNTALNTLSGTLLTVLTNITCHDIAKTVVLAGIGASVSFLVSHTLKWCIKKRK